MVWNYDELWDANAAREPVLSYEHSHCHICLAGMSNGTLLLKGWKLGTRMAQPDALESCIFLSLVSTRVILWVVVKFTLFDKV